MRIQRSFRAEMAHKVPGAYTCRCHHIHGHSYLFEVEATSRTPDQAHMVIDFKLLEACGIKAFLDGFDHAVVLRQDDDLAPLIERINPQRHLLVPFLPTAEMIAKACFEICAAVLAGHNRVHGGEARISAVRVYETARGAASYRAEDQGAEDFPEVRLNQWVISSEIRQAWMEHPALAELLRPA
jgi:6-pyruvoyl-tetrahydropterin synthase